jgi:hypothetical protein
MNLLKIRPLALSLLFLGTPLLFAADEVFSGPQPGEKTTPFTVVALSGDSVGKERTISTEGHATVLVFVHNVERSLVPLLMVVDQYGAERKDRLQTEVVFLFADRLAGEQRGKAVAGSLKLQAPAGLSVDGAEGPGNYGLNKDCLMTIVATKDNKVTASFALVQPGIADAPKVIAALAKACGDEAPPTLEQLNQRRVAHNGGGREGAPMRPEAARSVRPQPPVDISHIDLDTAEGMRQAIRELTTEVQSLRQEVNTLKAGSPPPPSRGEGAPARPAASIPGAVPADEKLAGWMRSFIRPTNDEAAVDQVIADVQAYIKGNADLRKQTIEAWTRILYFENYGTPHSRKAGREFLEKLQHEGQ